MKSELTVQEAYKAEKMFEIKRKVPFLLIRRCNLCGEFMESKHDDYGKIEEVSHDAFSHQCEVMWDTAPGGVPLGRAEVVGVVIDSNNHHA